MDDGTVLLPIIGHANEASGRTRQGRMKDEREIAVMHDFDGLSYKQIGAQLGLHESNICRFMRKRGYRVERNHRIVKETG